VWGIPVAGDDHTTRQHTLKDHTLHVGTRIHRRRLACGLTQARLADLASVSRGYISRLEAGGFARPSAALLLRIAHALEIDAARLWEESASARASLNEQPTPHDLSDQLLHLAHTLGQVRGLPVRTRGSLGGAAVPEEGATARLTLEDPHVPPHRWAMKVEGDALQGAGILTGDFVVIDPDRTLEREMLVVARVGAGSVITPYEPESTTPLQQPANPDDPASEASAAQILGAVSAIVRLVRPTPTSAPA